MLWTGLIARRLALPGLALLVGASFSTSMAFLEEGTCRRFEGRAAGNDPDGFATLDLCRDGDRLWGLLRVEGQAGVSVGELVGSVDRLGNVDLTDIDAVVDKPNDGWMFCFDDVYDLEWDPITRTVSGTYRSEECDDSGRVLLRAR